MIGLNSSASSYVPFSSTKSIRLNGTNEDIDVNDTFKTTFNDSFSISAWVKVDDGEPAATKYICGSSNSTSQDEVFIKITTAGLLSFTVKSDNDTGTQVTDSAVFVDNVNDWKHIVCTATKGGSGNTAFAIYVNGSAVASSPSSTLTVANHGNFDTDINISIGSLNNNGSKQGYFAGAIDEFGLWSSALSANAVSALYNNGKPTELSSPITDAYTAQGDLVAWYRMGDGYLDDPGSNTSGGSRAVIPNQVGVSIGANLATGNNNNFATGVGNWIAHGSGVSVGASGGILTVTLSGSGGATDNEGAELNSSIFEAGKIYRMSADIWLGTATPNDFRMHCGGASIPVSLTTTRTNFVVYFETANTNNVRLLDDDVDGDSGTFFIADFRLQKISPDNSARAINTEAADFRFETP
jgi:hypothetical protein